MVMTTSPQLEGWFAGRIPEGWFTGPPEVRADRDEILVVGTLAEPDAGAGADDEARHAARTARIQGHREDTRQHRMPLADEPEPRFPRQAPWAPRGGDVEQA